MSHFKSNLSINIVILLIHEQKESIVIKMLKEGYSIREIAKEVHMSFSDIGEINFQMMIPTRLTQLLFN